MPNTSWDSIPGPLDPEAGMLTANQLAGQNIYKKRKKQ